MNGEGATGGTGGPPSATGVVSGLFDKCDNGLSFYDVSWSTVLNATLYDTYVSYNQLTWWWAGSTSLTTEKFVGNVDGWVTARACNGYGCSGLSSDDFFFNHICAQ